MNDKINQNKDATINEQFIELAQKIYNQTGVLVCDVDFNWADKCSIDTQRYVVEDVKMETVFVNKK